MGLTAAAKNGHSTPTVTLPSKVGKIIETAQHLQKLGSLAQKLAQVKHEATEHGLISQDEINQYLRDVLGL